MAVKPYSNLVRFKQWADEGLYDVVGRNLGRLGKEDSNALLRILDHIFVVDVIFRNHLRGVANDFAAPRSDQLPDLGTLTQLAKEVDDWYVDHVCGLHAAEIDHPLDFQFTSGKPARMTVGEIIEHVCLHGTYHRGMAGVMLQKNGFQPNDDRVTDFLEAA